jgi:hypothetical protein
VYVKLGLVLFALEVRSPSTGRVRIAVNPSGFVIPDPHLYHVHGYVIAENAEDAQRVARVNILAMRSIEVRVPGGGGGAYPVPGCAGSAVQQVLCHAGTERNTRTRVHSRSTHCVVIDVSSNTSPETHTRSHMQYASDGELEPW